jgi:hypothetical protein
MLYKKRLGKIAQELNIYPFVNESDDLMKVRLFYSVAGRWALACLWNNELQNTVSIELVKNTIQECMRAFLQMSQEVGQQLPNVTLNALMEEIYRLYRETGYFYEKAYRVGAPVFMQASVDDCCFLRGISPGFSCKMSGLGPYCIGDNKTKTGSVPLEEMFHCLPFPIWEWWEKFQARQRFDLIKEWNQFEFLQKDIHIGAKWWKSRPDTDGAVSLTRTNNLPPREYHLYRFSNGVMQMSDALPVWQTEHFEYCRIAAAVMQKNGTPPLIFVNDVGGVKKIQLQYLLPPPEQNFFELYSWPSDFREFGTDAKDTKFHVRVNRVMAGEVYPAFRKLTSRLGYDVEEDKNGARC